MNDTQLADLKDYIAVTIGRSTAGLNKEIREISTDIKDLRTGANGMRVDINDLRTGVNEIRTDINGLRTDINEIRTDINGLRTDVNGLYEGIGGLSAEIVQLRTDMQGGFASIAEAIDRHNDELDDHGKRITRLESKLV